MKKIFILVIALLTLVLTVVQAQDYSQMEQMQKEILQLTADFQAGKITAQQYQERVTGLYKQLEEANKAVQQQGASFSAAQVRRIETLLDEIKRLHALYNEGRITEASFAQQVTPLSNEYDAITVPLVTDSFPARVQLNEVGEKIKKLWPGALAGWPPMRGAEAVIDVCGYGPFTQGAGTRASYSKFRSGYNGPVHSFTIYQTGATQATFDDLRRQIEQAAGARMEQLSDRYRVEVPNKKQGEPGYHLDLILDKDRLTFRIMLLHR